MFKITQNSVNRLDIELSGKLDAEEMEIALDELISKSKNIENGSHALTTSKGLNDP